MADSPAPRDGGRLSASPADGCGCQYDAAGRLFRTRCICPPEMTPEQTLRAVAGLGGAIGAAVAGVLAELAEARRRLRELETRVPSGFLDALDAVEQSEPLAEQRRAAVAPSESPPAALAGTEASEPGSGRTEALRGSYGAPQREPSDPETAEAFCATAGGTVRQSETGEGREAVDGSVEGADDPAGRLRRAAEWVVRSNFHRRMDLELAIPLAAWLRERAAYADAVGFCNDREALALADAVLGEVAE